MCTILLRRLPTKSGNTADDPKNTIKSKEVRWKPPNLLKNKQLRLASNLDAHETERVVHANAQIFENTEPDSAGFWIVR